MVVGVDAPVEKQHRHPSLGEGNVIAAPRAAEVVEGHPAPLEQPQQCRIAAYPERGTRPHPHHVQVDHGLEPPHPLRVGLHEVSRSPKPILFPVEPHEPHVFRPAFLRQCPGELERRHRARGVVVGPRRTRHRVVVPAHDHRRSLAVGPVGDDVAGVGLLEHRSHHQPDPLPATQEQPLSLPPGHRDPWNRPRGPIRTPHPTRLVVDHHHRQRPPGRRLAGFLEEGNAPTPHHHDLAPHVQVAIVARRANPRHRLERRLEASAWAAG